MGRGPLVCARFAKPSSVALSQRNSSHYQLQHRNTKHPPSIKYPSPHHAIIKMQATTTDFAAKRERSRSPRRRSRSPRHRRSYSPRSRSRSRGAEYRRSDRRSRSPAQTGAAPAGGYSGSYGAGRAQQPARSFDDRSQPKEQPGMQGMRENSQQDRRVYVGNLSYDVKWHHLKDFMRQGKLCLCLPVVA
jgi:hypothetical protein